MIAVARIARLSACLLVALALAFLPGCGAKEEDHEGHQGAGGYGSTRPEPTVLRAVAQLEPTEGHDVRGTVTFTREGDKVRVRAEITGLTPGKHGFHIHEHGDCSAPDATSAGAHFDPTGRPHAGPDDDERHVGDLGNVEADEDGRAVYDRLDAHLDLEGPHAIVGKSVIVHAEEDDLKSQPSGDAGGRVACGVIRIP